MKLTRICGFCIILIVMPLWWNLAFANSAASQQEKLAHISQSISSLKKSLSSSKQKQTQLQSELQTIEEKIGGSAKQYEQTVAQLRGKEKQLYQIQTEHANYVQQLQQQKVYITQQIRAAYMLGRQQYLKILLNGENPAKIDRYVMYYHYLTVARNQAITQLQQTLTKIASTAEQIRQQTQQLESVKAEQASARYKLTQEKYMRRHLLHKLEASIGSKQQQLTQLVNDRNHLRNVISQLQKEKYYYAPGHNFGQAYHQLAWPIRDGKLVQTFNQLIADGRMHSSGILLQAPMGTPVHAIYPGKVVFAHWLRGYGLLAIIQHGSRFMTLYAHAESLYVQNGDQIKPGQVIATVGNSGGLQQSALYFEITHDGQAVDPLKWLRKSS